MDSSYERGRNSNEGVANKNDMISDFRWNGVVLEVRVEFSEGGGVDDLSILL